MRDLYDVIIAPVMTEKATRATEDGNVYTFVVNPKANKAQIAAAVEKFWDVKVEDVRTARYSGKTRRAFMGRFIRTNTVGRRADWKKAMVRLSDGDSIELYEQG